MRDGSKADATERRKIFSTMLVMKITLALIGACIIVFAAPSFSTLPGSKIILPIVAIVLVLDTMRDFFTAFLRAQERMEWDAGIFITTNLGILIFGFVFLAMQKSPSAFTWAYVAGDVLGVTLALWVIHAYFADIKSYISLRRIRPILGAAWPFAGHQHARHPSHKRRHPHHQLDENRV